MPLIATDSTVSELITALVIAPFKDIGRTFHSAKHALEKRNINKIIRLLFIFIIYTSIIKEG
ncbi:hypothetical protein A8F88_08670 [Escherichia coli]|nr:hypothetical protein A8F88_08670 [Escherichia coli]